MSLKLVGEGESGHCRAKPKSLLSRGPVKITVLVAGVIAGVLGGRVIVDALNIDDSQVKLTYCPIGEGCKEETLDGSLEAIQRRAQEICRTADDCATFKLNGDPQRVRAVARAICLQTNPCGTMRVGNALESWEEPPPTR